MKPRHYRVVKKEVENKNFNDCGIFIPKQKHGHIIVATLILMSFMFIKGLLVGLLISRDS